MPTVDIMDYEHVLLLLCNALFRVPCACVQSFFFVLLISFLYQYVYRRYLTGYLFYLPARFVSPVRATW